LRVLYVSDHGPYINTFIRQDVDCISKVHDVLYIATESDQHYNNKQVKTKLVKYPSGTIQSKLRWRLEKLGFYFNWSDKNFGSRLKSEIGRFNPDIIHCQFLYESAKLLQNIKINKPVIVNIRGYGASTKLVNKKYVDWLKKLANHNNIFPIYVCKHLKKNLISKNIIFKNDGIILYTGVDLKKFKRTRQDSKSKHKTFIQVGAFNDKKGQLITIKSFNKFVKNHENKNAKLVFIGEGKNLKKAKELVEELNISEFVAFKGKLNQSEIIEELDVADVFVHHSITSKKGDQEGIPNALVEAMAMEMPVLTTFHSGIPELVSHGINGFLCEENDVLTYSEQMNQIYNWGYRKENRDLIEKKFSLKKHIDKLNEMYDYIKRSL
jgi:colanic acid/amylovoran biosynthesis glycosyltransferase